jgi:hypothetical protein
MKKKNVKKLTLQKRSISTLDSQKIKGGSGAYFTTSLIICTGRS